MNKRTSFPSVFWIANSIEILERFAYYGIYMGFGVYMESLGYSRSQLGIIQSIFLTISYLIPVFSGTFADRFGFKKMLIISYLAYIPTILLLILTKSFSGIALTMLGIGFAAGIFKPLIAGTVRLTTDSTNKTLGFGIFYMMVNVGASIGPIVAGKLRAVSWNYAFIMAAISISVMFVVTLLFYKEPEKEASTSSVGRKIMDIVQTLGDVKFAVFLVILGVFFWLPFWAFFNLCPLFVDKHLDTVQLYNSISSVLGDSFTHLLARQENGVWRINGEALAHTGWIILVFQIAISKIFEKRAAIPSFLFGLLIAAIGFAGIGFSIHAAPILVLSGVFVFAVGEMITSPRIQEYITWIAPKEKAGLYMGSNFLATCIGALLSGLYTSLFGIYEKAGNPEFIWYTLAVHCLLAILAIWTFTKVAGEFKEMEE